MADRLTGAAAAEPYKSVVRPALLVELQFASGPVRAWSGVGPLTWNGVTWAGVGLLGRVSTVEETLELKAAGASFQLSGIPSDLLTPVISEPIQSRAALLWLAFFDEDWAVVPEPVLLFRGRMDTVEIADGGSIATITLFAESRLRDLERARVRRYTCTVRPSGNKITLVQPIQAAVSGATTVTQRIYRQRRTLCPDAVGRDKYPVGRCAVEL